MTRTTNRAMVRGHKVRKQKPRGLCPLVPSTTFFSVVEKSGAGYVGLIEAADTVANFPKKATARPKGARLLFTSLTHRSTTLDTMARRLCALYQTGSKLENQALGKLPALPEPRTEGR